jgi:hypothetical protein
MGIGEVIAFMLALSVLADEFWHTRVLDRFWKQGMALAVCFAFLLVVVRAQFVMFTRDSVISLRNFYGVLYVDEDDPDEPLLHIRELLNGHILHGSGSGTEEWRPWKSPFNARSGGGEKSLAQGYSGKNRGSSRE